MFRKYISDQMQRVRSSPYAGMSGGEVCRKLEEALVNVTTVKPLYNYEKGGIEK